MAHRIYFLVWLIVEQMNERNKIEEKTGKEKREE